MSGIQPMPMRTVSSTTQHFTLHKMATYKGIEFPGEKVAPRDIRVSTREGKGRKELIMGLPAHLNSTTHLACF
jgi:hypothetical protein